jgi:aspartyl-tRNA(Asn)/glutamyl-tRNA(Gln) amidotransferase subunit A
VTTSSRGVASSAAAERPGAAETARRIRAGDLSPVQAVEDALIRIEEIDPGLNAFCLVLDDEARLAAQVAEDRLGSGESLGPLGGVPVTVKDAIWQRGLPATCGSRALAGFLPQSTAVAVERLEAGGAIVIGRTNVPELCLRGSCANLLHGVTRNPWDPSRTPGGSSGGAAAAVAAGMGDLALGTDGGGSVRIPASFCGIAALKPTFGLIPKEPWWPGWMSLNHLGPMARTVEDLVLALSVMAGPDPADPLSLPSLNGGDADIDGARVAWSDSLGDVPLDDGVRDTFRAAVERFGTLGVEIEEADPGLARPIDAWNTIAVTDTFASDGRLLETGLLEDDTRAVVEAGAKVTGPQYAEARNEAHRYSQAMAAFFGGFDLLLTPATEVVAFGAEEVAPRVIGGQEVGEFYDDWCHFLYPFNLTGQPAASVPMGTAEHGMPIGLQIVGRRFEDSLVLAAAAAWERLAPWPLPA